MRYLVQIMMMLADVIFLFMMGLGMYSVTSEPIDICFFIAVILICLAVWQWDKLGGFNAWRPAKVKRFLENAKKQGL